MVCDVDVVVVLLLLLLLLVLQFFLENQKLLTFDFSVASQYGTSMHNVGRVGILNVWNRDCLECSVGDELIIEWH